MKKKKRHILLLEVLVALFLVLLCFYPLLHSQVMIALEEKRFAREAMLERAVTLRHAEAVEDLYQNRIPFTFFKEKKEEQVEVAGFVGTICYSVSRDKAEGQYNLLQIQYVFPHQTFTYHIFAEVLNEGS